MNFLILETHRPLRFPRLILLLAQSHLLNRYLRIHFVHHLYLDFLKNLKFFEFNHNIELIISIGFFICMVGFIDDRINLKPSNKVIFIIIPSAYLILNGININNLGYYEYIGLNKKLSLKFVIF